MAAVKSNYAADDLDTGDDGYDPREALHAIGYAGGIGGKSLGLTLEESHATEAWAFDAVICGFGEGTRDFTNYLGDMKARDLDPDFDPFK